MPNNYEISDTNNNELVTEYIEDDVVAYSEVLLEDVNKINSNETIKVPIAQLATLGAGFSSLIPALRTVTQTTTVNTNGLFRLANATVGDTLKQAKNGNFWGAFKTSEGKSKFVQLQNAGPLSETSTGVLPIDPATMMIAAALFSVEQQLGRIEEISKDIMSFLETEKESETEADIKTLTSIINKYKFSWDNEKFIDGSHSIVLQIKRTARKNLESYIKKLKTEIKKGKDLFTFQMSVDSKLEDFIKIFKYYRLSLYGFSLASLLEIMLSGNFKEENISYVRNEIKGMAEEYRYIFSDCSVYLEEMTNSSIDLNVVKGIGEASQAIGQFIGGIPFIKDGPVDEFLQDSGKQIKKSIKSKNNDVLESFSKMKSPEISMFINKMDDFICIYNHTQNICFDKDNIYLLV